MVLHRSFIYSGNSKPICTVVVQCHQCSGLIEIGLFTGGGFVTASGNNISTDGLFKKTASENNICTGSFVNTAICVNNISTDGVFKKTVSANVISTSGFLNTPIAVHLTPPKV